MKKYIKNHLVIKIFLITASILIAAGFAIYGMIAFGMSRSYLVELNESLESETKGLILQLPEVTNEEMKKMLHKFSIEYGASIILKNSAGEKLSEFGEIGYSIDPNADSTNLEESSGITKIYTFKGNDENIYQLEVFGTRQRSNIALALLNRILPMLGGFTFFSAIIVAMFYARYITKPILKISKVSERLSNLDFKIHCDENRSDEIGILGENMNALAESLENALDELNQKNNTLLQDIELEKQLEQQQLSFFSAVSHELKTPVTVLKGQLQGMLYNVGGYKDRDKYLRRSFQVVSSMENMIQEILDVSKLKTIESSQNTEIVLLCELISELLQKIEDIAIDKGIIIHKEMTCDVELLVNRAQFTKIISNLLINAIEYTDSGGHIWITVQRKEGNCILLIENETEPIAEEDIRLMFEPFYRRDKSRTRNAGGSGLGLYIVKMILELHQCTYHLYNTDRGLAININLNSVYKRSVANL